jgi:mono/diheme cytochrome c family protein
MSWRLATGRKVVVGALLLPLASGCGGKGDDVGTNGAATTALKPGDAARGKTIFARSACGACHTLAAAGSKRNVGPNLDEVAKRYDAKFIRTSITNPSAYLEKGESGSIGGTRSYSNSMPAYGPKELPPQHLSEQEHADLIAFIESG